MKRGVKILVACICCIVGCGLSINPQLFFDTDSEWLYSLFSGVGFVLMIVSGLYGVLKLLRPVICKSEQIDTIEYIKA